jgi:hypothetical protein
MSATTRCRPLFPKLCLLTSANVRFARTVVFAFRYSRLIVTGPITEIA